MTALEDAQTDKLVLGASHLLGLRALQRERWGLSQELQLPEGIGRSTKVSGQSLFPVFWMLTLSSGFVLRSPPTPGRPTGERLLGCSR